MVQQMTNEELLNIEETDKFYVRFRLTNKEIIEWKENKKFKHLKTELESIPNIKFGCLEQEEYGCVYNFILPTRPLMRRLIRVISSLMSNKKEHIYRVSNQKCVTTSHGNYLGTPKVCNLF